jgi:hypothetical protein
MKDHINMEKIKTAFLVVEVAFSHRACSAGHRHRSYTHGTHRRRRRRRRYRGTRAGQSLFQRRRG